MSQCCSPVTAAVLRLLGLVAAVGLSLPAAGEPVPKAKPEPRGEVVKGWSLGLKASSDKLDEDYRHPASLTVTLRNHAEQPRTLQEVRVPDKDLRHAEGLSYVLRFKDGLVIEVPNPSSPAGRTAGLPPPHLPVRVPAGGKVEAVRPTVNGLLIFFNREAREAYKKCPEFAVTVITTKGGLNLKSNTVFINGKFELPKDHDPIADAKAYREKKKQKRK